MMSKRKKVVARNFMLPIPDKFKSVCSQDNINVVEIIDPKAAEPYLENLHNDALNSDRMVGFDTESRPQTNYSDQVLGLVQLCSATMIVLLHVKAVTGMPCGLERILKDTRIKKAGSAIMDDVHQMFAFFSMPVDFSLTNSHFTDTQHLASTHNVSSHAPGLLNVVYELFGHHLKKDLSCRLYDWTRTNLPNDVLQYAAMDAFASRAIAVYFARTIDNASIPQSVPSNATTEQELDIECIFDKTSGQQLSNWADIVDAEEKKTREEEERRVHNADSNEPKCRVDTTTTTVPTFGLSNHHKCTWCNVTLYTVDAMCEHMYSITHINNGARILFPSNNKKVHDSQ